MPDPDRDILDLIEAGRKIEAIKLAREHLGMGLAEAKALVEGLATDAGAGGQSGCHGTQSRAEPSAGSTTAGTPHRTSSSGTQQTAADPPACLVCAGVGFLARACRGEGFHR